MQPYQQYQQQNPYYHPPPAHPYGPVPPYYNNPIQQNTNEIQRKH